MKSVSGYFSFLKITLAGRSAGNILLATLFSFSFSITVILCTFGLMDGFDHLLKSGLRHSSGDILVSSRRGFFRLNDELRERIQVIAPRSVAPVIQTEAFALHQGKSKGVLVRGVESRNFSLATGLSLNIDDQGVVIGEELARALNLKVGDELALTLSEGHESADALPSVKIFKVSGLVRHGIYQKDLRFVYLNRSDVAELLGVDDKVNLIVLATQDMQEPLESLEKVASYLERHPHILLRSHADDSSCVLDP